MTTYNSARCHACQGDAKKIVVVSAVFLLALLSVGWSSRGSSDKPDEISCRKLTLKDAKGRDRIVLSVGGKGPKITMLEPDGKARIEMAIEDIPGRGPDTPISIASIKLMDRSHNVNMLARSFDPGAGEDSNTSIRMWNGSKSGSASMGVDPHGVSTFELKGKTGEISARNIRDDASQFSIIDNNGKIRISLVSNSVSDRVWIKIKDKDGSDVWRTPE